MNKFTEKVTQNLKVDRKKRKMDSSEIEQDLSSYQTPSKKCRQNLKKENEGFIHEEKMFICDICNKSSKTTSDLNRHIESVHGGRTFKCDICPSNFTQKGHLKTHIESVHGGKTWCNSKVLKNTAQHS